MNPLILIVGGFGLVGAGIALMQNSSRKNKSLTAETKSPITQASHAGTVPNERPSEKDNTPDSGGLVDVDDLGTDQEAE